MLFLMQSALVELDEFLEQNFMSGAFKNESMVKIAGFFVKEKTYEGQRWYRSKHFRN